MEKPLRVDKNEPKLVVMKKEGLSADMNHIKNKTVKLYNDLYSFADKVGGTLPDIVTPIKNLLSPRRQ